MSDGPDHHAPGAGHGADHPAPGAGHGADHHEPGAAGRHGHVVVCGLRSLGVEIVEQLQEAGIDVVVIDDDPDQRLLPLLQGWGVALVTASPRQPSGLEAAGVDRARAVICVEENDLHNLETALVAHDLRAGLRVVAHVANTAVGRALGEVTGKGSVLDVAALAAPPVVQACLNRRYRDVVLGDEAFRIVDTHSTRPGTLRDLYGDLVPIAVASGASRDVEICPGRDLSVSPDDIVTLLGTPAELRDVLPPGDQQDSSRPAPSRRAQIAALVALVRSVGTQFDRAFRLAVLAIFALVAVSALALRFGYHTSTGQRLGILEAIYFTVETISTVGFGDFSFATQATWLEVFGIGVIIVGATLIATLFALLTNLLFSRNIADALGQQRITRTHDHVVVIGLGAVGVRVVEALVRRGCRVVVIERDEDNRHLRQIRALRVPVIAGDATQSSTLDVANAGAASAVAALTSDDLTNLEAALAIRDYLRGAGSSAPVVMRVFDRSLSSSIERNFGFRSVRSTSALAAPWFVGAALGLDIASTFYAGQQLLLVARLTVASAGGLAGLAMQDLSARIRVVAISRSPDHRALEHPPRRNTRFAPGDHAYLIGPHEELLSVLQRDARDSVPA